MGDEPTDRSECVLSCTRALLICVTIAYLIVGARAQNTSYGGGGTARPPNTKKETCAFPATDAPRVFTRDLEHLFSKGGVWKGATEESARRGTLKFLPTEGGSRMQ
jgi:hypothetical protein